MSSNLSPGTTFSVNYSTLYLVGVQGVSDEEFLRVIGQCRSVMDVVRRLGYTALAGGTHAYISRKIKHSGADTSHFITARDALRLFRRDGKKTAAEVLVKTSSGRREAAFRLRRALIESGVAYRCCGCAVGPEWNGSVMVLEVDHKNNDFTDNRIENLRFLCPNCHSQMKHAMNKGKTSATRGNW